MTCSSDCSSCRIPTCVRSPVGLATIPGQHGLDVPLLMAGSLVSALPAVLVYLAFQRHLITGLTMGMGK